MAKKKTTKTSETAPAKKTARKKPATKAEDGAAPKKKKATAREKDPADKDESKPKAKTGAKAPAKRKSRARKDVRSRQRLAWAVFNHAMKPVAKYAWNQKKAAEKKAKELSPEGKPPHFVARIKEDIVEE
jgi:hypothetical protein